jgi:DNA-directed RNA polymerase specialized sigma24 family protein
MSQRRPPDTTPTRLDQIPTQWSLLRIAHRNSMTGSGEARNVLVLRYAAAIRNYVGALIRNEHDADEVSQEVVIRLLRGQFASATPERGSFRRLLMVATHNLVRTYWSRQQRKPRADIDLGSIAGAAEESALEAEALASWKQSLLDMAWKGLEEYQNEHPGTVAYTLLRLRADYPDDESEALAGRLSAAAGKPFRADAVRQQLRRARVRFAQILLEEVSRGLDEPTPARVEEELIETGLMPYVEDLLPTDWRTRGELSEED